MKLYKHQEEALEQTKNQERVDLRGRTHIDLIGNKYGMLTPYEYVVGSKWKCKCDCGNETIVSTCRLTTGRTKSCGCLKHKGYHYTHRLGKPKTYSHWYNIKSRCLNPNHPRYSDWGGRGITVCDEWKDDFKAFHDYVSQLPHFGEEGYISLDRIDNDGNYEPGNVRWGTALIQNNNKRNVILLEYQGEVHNCTEWSKILKLGKDTVRQRYHKGYSVEECLFGKKVI